MFDPAKVTYAKLLDAFWRSIDPLVKDHQFCDHGDQYRTAIFYPHRRGSEARRGDQTKGEAKFAPRVV